jgi:ribosomal protein L31
VLNKEILITAFRAGQKSQFKEDGLYTTIQFEIDDEKHVIFTGSQVLTEQLERYQEHLPFLATIKKINRYFTLT